MQLAFASSSCRSQPCSTTPSLTPAALSMYPTSLTSLDCPATPALNLVADAAAGWQHHSKPSPSSGAIGATSPEEAPAETLVGWTEKIQQSDEQLMEKVGVTYIPIMCIGGT